MTFKEVEVLSLDVIDLSRMKSEFQDCYNKLFTDSMQLLKKAWLAKLYSMKKCRQQQREYNLSTSLETKKSFFEQKVTRQATFQIRQFQIQELEDATFSNSKIESSIDSFCTSKSSSSLSEDCSKLHTPKSD